MADDTELAEGEHTVLLLHPHWKILLRPTLILLLVAAAAAVVLLMIPPGSYATPGRIAAGVLAVVVAVTWFGVPFLRWQTTTYELTTRRLRLREGILSRSGRDFPLIRISDVSFSHGLIDRLLGCGRLGSNRPASTGSSSCPRSRRSRGCRPHCSSWSRTSMPGWPGRSPEPDRRRGRTGARV